MIFQINQPAYEDFSVTNNSDELVSGLTESDFSINIYDPDDVEVSITLSPGIYELGNGHYRMTFIPNKIGVWYIVVYNDDYFPWGKSGNIQVNQNTIDTVSEFVKRILGLTQENYYLDNTSYTNEGNMTTGRIRIYSDSISVGTDDNILSTYNVNASYDENGDLTTYSVKKE